MPVITTNNAANVAVQYLNFNTAAESESVAQLASGSRIVKASDDPSGRAIGSQLQAQAAILEQNQSNVSQGSSILQSADGALAQISNVLQQMIALASEAASGQVTNTQRSQDINTTYSQLQTEIGSIINSTSYAGQSLLTGTFLSNVKFLIGASASNTLTVSIPGLRAGTLLGTASSGVATAQSASAAIASLSAAINTINYDRAKVGAYESQFNFSGQAISSAIIATKAAASTILDADVATVKTQLSSQDVLSQASIAAVAQASMLPQELLKLIQAA